ncbi:signal peptidase I [Carbonactinospora thermoautotrophica]|uniref:Signal peptidase I n=1 Tax=Carbonactinospora thermoautotrophica TaxID=1469144 RepID=A0A132MP76_9ACTN|nr:signal peptidase I [Carbonactinospora thermoautotrophica]KWW99666.1 Signal peptidase I [Carbonactinospora thermoautotrophica]MCX9191766.1 signal peptidase I [Carbonactinospora thermoautotrophica]
MDDNDQGVPDRGSGGPADPAGAPEPRSRPPANRRVWIRFGIAAVLAIALATALKWYLVEPYYVPENAMADTLHAGDRVLIDKRAYRDAHPRRGDIVVADVAGVLTPVPTTRLPKEGLAQELIPVSRWFGVDDPEYAMALRVIGQPGDRVRCCDAEGRLLVNGKPLEEPYVARFSSADMPPFSIRVPQDAVFLMGDNRDLPPSAGKYPVPGIGGVVPLDRVFGRVTFVYWPLANSRAVDASGERRGG